MMTQGEGEIFNPGAVWIALHLFSDKGRLSKASSGNHAIIEFEEPDPEWHETFLSLIIILCRNIFSLKLNNYLCKNLHQLKRSILIHMCDARRNSVDQRVSSLNFIWCTVIVCVWGISVSWPTRKL